LYGYPREELLAMRVADIRAEEEDALSPSAPLSALDAQAPRGRRERHRRKDGECIEVEVSAQPIDFAGRPAALEVVMDVTARERAEAALRESDAQKAAILEAALDCVISIDHQGRIVE